MSNRELKKKQEDLDLCLDRLRDRLYRLEDDVHGERYISNTPWFPRDEVEKRRPSRTEVLEARVAKVENKLRVFLLELEWRIRKVEHDLGPAETLEELEPDDEP